MKKLGRCAVPSSGKGKIAMKKTEFLAYVTRDKSAPETKLKIWLDTPWIKDGKWNHSLLTPWNVPPDWLENIVKLGPGECKTVVVTIEAYGSVRRKAMEEYLKPEDWS